MTCTARESLRTKCTFGHVVGVILLGAAALSTAAIAQNSNSVFGPNVLIFDTSMSTSQIQSAVNAVAAQQISNQFGTQRYSLLFEPGVYGSDTPLEIPVGYYTEVAGLGASPTDVTINGHVDVNNQCTDGSCIALDNFWRSVSNLTIHVQGLSGCQSSATFWAVSQGAPMRRVNVTGGDLTFDDYCTGPSYSSGGFMADSQTQGGTIVSGSQQQFYVRNSNIDGWSNALWNQVFSGVIGAPAQSYPNPAYTTLATTPVSREKPFLYMDSKGKFRVFVPSVQRNSSGATWVNGATPGRSMPIDDFFVAQPSTTVEELNRALQQGKSLILSPGVYQLTGVIKVNRPDTLIFGMGDATLVPQNGTAAIEVGDLDGVEISGLIIDAGPEKSSVLLKMGSSIGNAHRADPSVVQDVFFRIGGATLGKATTSLEVDSDDVIIDDIWAWRADHGNPGTVGWTVNTADHGLVVNGDRVVATGLAVEHYQKQQVMWNGNGGETIFYQSELPYDPPSQGAWKDGKADGYPSYVVADSVNTHKAYGLGIYCYFDQGINIIEDNAMTVPVANGVQVNDAGTIWLAGSGQITHVINGSGGSVTSANPTTLSPVVTYP